MEQALTDTTNAKTVLVVEDEPALQEAVKLKLSQAGVNVITASNGEEALNILEKQVPDLLWLDVLMPRMNGLELLSRIRQNEKLKYLPVLVASVSGSPEKIKQAFSLGVTDYMVKSQHTIESMAAKALSILKEAKPHN